MTGSSSCHVPKLLQCLVHLAQETHRVEPLILRCQDILLFRRQSLAAVELSTLHIAEDSPYDLELGNVFFTDVVRDPRQGDLVILGWRNAQTPFYLVDSAAMTVIERELPFLGDKAIDLELLP